jgi:hypothetical protein
VDPTRRGPDWMKITPAAGSLFHEKEHLSATHPIGSSRKSVSMVPAATTPPNEMRCQDMDPRRISPRLAKAFTKESVQIELHAFLQAGPVAPSSHVRASHFLSSVLAGSRPVVYRTRSESGGFDERR